MKKKILYLSLLSIIGTTLIGCDNNNNKTEFTFTYNVNYEGGENRVETIKRGDKAQNWEIRRSGFEFLGWYDSSSLDNLFNFDTPIEEDTTVYAGWKEEVISETVMVTFDYSFNDVTNISRVSLTSGDTLLEDFAPVVERLGYEVEGWYLDNTYKNKFNFGEDVVTEDITLYANYESTANFEYNEDGSIKFENVTFNFAVNNDLGGLESAFNKLVVQFNKEHRGEILVRLVDNDTTSNSEITAKLHQTESFNETHTDYHNMDEVLDLANIEFNKEDYYEYQIQDNYFEGRLKTLPLGSWVPHIVYNKALLDEFNNSVIPSSFDEFNSLARKITEAKKTDSNWYGAVTADADWNFTEITGNCAYIQNDSPHYYLNNENELVCDWNNIENGGQEKALNALKSLYTYFGENKNDLQIGKREGTYDGGGMPGLSAVGSGNALFGLVGTPGARDYYKSTAGVSDANLDTKLGIIPLSNFFAIDKDNPNASKIFVKGYSYGVTASGPEDLYKKAAAGVFGDYLTKNLAQIAGEMWMYPANKSQIENATFRNSDAFKYYLQYFGNPENFYTLPGTRNEYSIFNYTMETLILNLFVNENYDEAAFKEILNTSSSSINALL